MTALAMGAAARPPVVSLPFTPPFSTITATAILAVPFCVAKPTNHACGGVSLPLTKIPVSAVPVLPPIDDPGQRRVLRLGRGDLRGRARAVLHHPDHHLLELRVEVGIEHGALLLGLGL